MKRTTFGLLVLVIGMLSLWGCSSTTANVLFGDEFSSLNTDVWLSFPSLTPFASLEGSNIPGEVKVEDGILKLSRFAPELSGGNQVSLIQAKNTVDLPDTFTVTMRFRNEFIAFGLSNFVLEIYDQKIAVG